MTNNRFGKAVCVGETVLDIIFRENIPVAAKPGGSMLNSSVSLGRTGIEVQFVSDYGCDHAGELIHSFLSENGVSTQYVSRYTDGQTTLALAFLDQEQNATYSFYKIFPKERLTLPFPDAGRGDIVLFGSYYALSSPVRAKIAGFIRKARADGAFILYDPNFRKAHLSELESLRPFIMENIGMADLVRGSDEDFEIIFGATSAGEAYEHIREAGCNQLIYTRNRFGVAVMVPGYTGSYAVPSINPVSTIGAGDSFNAGIIHALLSHAAPSKEISDQQWNQIIAHATRFSSDVCMSFDNYISHDLADHLKRTSHERW